MRKNKIYQLFHFYILFFTLLILGCSKDENTNNQEIITSDNVVSTNMSISKNRIQFGYLENTNSFVITNLSNTSIDWNWELTTSSSFIAASPNSGTLAAGASVVVTLTLDRSNMITQIYNLNAKISNNKGQIFTQFVEISNYKENKWFIGGDVVDAEYDRVNDVMIVVSKNPNQIRKLNLVTKTEESLSLNDVPKCISIKPGGNYAAVGYTTSFSHINLSTMTIENNYSVSTEIYDIVLAPNNWTYITPAISNQNMRCINLSNGQETLSQDNLPYFAPTLRNTKAKLHPSGNYIYTSCGERVPDDIYKFDIRTGTAKYLYDSSYHGDYDFGDNLWISDAGNKIFTSRKNTFSSSTAQSDDIKFLSKFPELAGEANKVIDIMDVNTNSDRICTILVNDGYNYIKGERIRIYDTQLSYRGEFEIPKHLNTMPTGEPYLINSPGHFGFFNSSGSKFYVLVRYINPTKWAIATINVP